MAQLTVIYWRDIPAQVVAKAGRRSAKIKLAERFEKAIDMAAMKDGMAGSDDYLGEWRRGEQQACEEDLEMEAQALAARLEEEFDDERLRRLVADDGRAA